MTSTVAIGSAAPTESGQAYTSLVASALCKTQELREVAELRFAEEIMLLLLHDADGRFVHVPPWQLGYALAGGVLMDLALANRIDTDRWKLFVTSPEPIGDPLLDPTLAAIANSPERHEPRYWVEFASKDAPAIRQGALDRLVARGILERRRGRVLWVFGSRRYPLVDGTAEREVKLRVLDVLLGDDIPDPRDVVIICLAHACGLFPSLLGKDELARAFPRIEQVRKLDLIGQAVTAAVADGVADAERRVQFEIDQQGHTAP